MSNNSEGLTRGEFLKAAAVGVVSLGALLTPRWWGGQLDASRASESPYKLGNSLDWDLAMHNTLSDNFSWMLAPSDDPNILKWQLQEGRVLEAGVPNARFLDTGRNEGHLFLATHQHYDNMGPLIITPEMEKYIVRAKINFAHYHIEDDFGKATRLDDIDAYTYGVVQPSVNAKKVFKYVVVDLDSKKKEKVTNQYTGFDSRYVDFGSIDMLTGQIRWIDQRHQEAWDKMPAIAQFPSMFGLGGEILSLSNIASTLAGFVLPEGVTVKDRVTHAMLTNPPFLQTEYGILLLKQVGINARTVLNEMQLLHGFTERMQGSSQPKMAE